MTQPTLSQADHDLLIVINTKLDVFAAAQAALAAQVAKDYAELSARMTILERKADRQDGFLAGGKLVWAIIGALPPSAIVAIGAMNR